LTYGEQSATYYAIRRLVVAAALVSNKIYSKAQMLLLIFGALGALAQAPPQAAFEAASIKRSAPARIAFPVMTGGPGTNSPERFTGRNLSLSVLIRRAYGVTWPWNMSGPGWLDSDNYDVDATIPAGATAEQFTVMLQNLLKERFGLAAHTETREISGYELRVGSGGPKLKKADESQQSPGPPTPGRSGNDTPARLIRDSDGFMVLAPGVTGIIFSPSPSGGERLTAHAQTMADLAVLLQKRLFSEVVDKTGLTGTYDFALTYLAPNERPGGPANDPASALIMDTPAAAAANLLQALERHLGLKVVAAKVPVPVVVIDRVNRVPTEN
jgi:uncharacterized protein (TIGR03435 family)